MQALSVYDVSKRFRAVRALDSVSFDLPEGAIAGLVGPNGAGKTTLFSIIAGFLRPSGGEVKLFGRPVGDERSKRGEIGVLPQDALFQHAISIRRQFDWYGQLMGLDREQARAESQKVLEKVDLVEEASRRGDQLSHGMHKRMAIAQCLINAPRLILLDEPTAGLDPLNARKVRQLIAGLRGRHTAIVSSHNLDEIADLCDFIIILDHGKLVESRSMAELTGDDSQVSFVLLDVAPAGLEEELGRVSAVLGVTLTPDRRKVKCHLRGGSEEDPRVLSELLVALSAGGARFSEMAKGSSLEDRFLEMTSGDRDADPQAVE